LRNLRAATPFIVVSMLLAQAIFVQAGDALGQPSREQGVPFQEGISFAAWWSGQYSDPGADLSLELLASTGADWVALIVTGYQETYTSTTVDYSSVRTPSDDDLIHVINRAHELGLQVMLKPHLDLSDEVASGHWRGDIGSGFTTEAEWSAWFASYQGFIEHYATLAQAYGADQFCIGTELLGTTHRSDDWREIIGGVRALYDGPIVYASLHGGEETSITWWDAVDYIGVDAYYRLADNDDPTLPELIEAWESPAETLAGLAATYNRPILLTEIGYRSQNGCTNHPWDSACVEGIDLAEQALAYQAAFESLYHQPWLAGLFWWMWPVDRFESGVCDEGFSPHLKPAEDVLRAWYGGEPVAPPPILFPDAEQTVSVYEDALAPDWLDWSWDATVDLAADEALLGTNSISVTAAPWGALSLRRAAFNSDSFHWLEFYVFNPAAAEPNLVVLAETAEGIQQPAVPVNDCRHVDDGTLDPGVWQRVRIPLDDLGVQGLDWVRLSIQNQSGTATFWIDEIRFLGATPPAAEVFLPIVLQAQR